jgi:SAM-dependent methyltransferase
MDSSVGEQDENVAFYERLAPRYALFFGDFDQSMAEEGEWLEGVIGTEPRDVLDACCGSGRQSVPLAQRGHRVVGVDACAAMLAEARRIATERNVELDLHHLAFLDLPDDFREGFDWVIAMGNGLSHLPDAASICSALRALKDCRRRSGKCLIGIKDFDRIGRERKRFHPRSRFEIEGKNYFFFDIWEFEDPILISHAYLSEAGDESSRKTLGATHEYMLGSEELHRLAGEAGFSTVKRLKHQSEAAFELSG